MRRAIDGPPRYPAVDPVGADQSRPFWSVMIPTVGREYLAETLASVLAQEPGPRDMQIEVVDNGAPSVETEAVVRRLGGGRIGYFRQPRPVSMADNWTTCVERARGRWVHILHDDDVVRGGFYAAQREAVARWPAVAMTFCQVLSIGEAREPEIVGTPYPGPALVTDLPQQLAKRNFICASSVVASRGVYETVGGFDRSLVYTPDWEMWSRVAAVGPAGYLGGPYLLYRDHAGSFSRSREIRARKAREIFRAAESAIARLPARPPARDIRRLARRAAADSALRECWLLQLHGQSAQALPLALTSLSLRPSRYGVLLLARVVAAVAAQHLRRSVEWRRRRDDEGG